MSEENTIVSYAVIKCIERRGIHGETPTIEPFLSTANSAMEAVSQYDAWKNGINQADKSNIIIEKIFTFIHTRRVYSEEVPYDRLLEEAKAEIESKISSR